MNQESIHHNKIEFSDLITDKSCPKCAADLRTSLLEYPEYIFYNGKVHRNEMNFDKSTFDQTELIETYIIE